MNEKKKNDTYGNRIKQQLGGEFIPCVFSSCGSIGPAAKKIIDIIANKIANRSLEKLVDIKVDIKKDVVMSLMKSIIMGIRSSRNNIISQIHNFRSNESL